MAVKLWGSKTPGNAQNERDKALLRNKKKVVKMLVIVVLLFGFCWLPLQTYHILEVSWSDINTYRYINIIWFCCDWLAMSNSCYNPFIYGIYNVSHNKTNKEFDLLSNAVSFAVDELLMFIDVSLLCISGKIQERIPASVSLLSLRFRVPLNSRLQRIQVHVHQSDINPIEFCQCIVAPYSPHQPKLQPQWHRIAN